MGRVVLFRNIRSKPRPHEEMDGTGSPASSHVGCPSRCHCEECVDRHDVWSPSRTRGLLAFALPFFRYAPTRVTAWSVDRHEMAIPLGTPV